MMTGLKRPRAYEGTPVALNVELNVQERKEPTLVQAFVQNFPLKPYACAICTRLPGWINRSATPRSAANLVKVQVRDSKQCEGEAHRQRSGGDNRFKRDLEMSAFTELVVHEIVASRLVRANDGGRGTWGRPATTVTQFT